MEDKKSKVKMLKTRLRELKTLHETNKPESLPANEQRKLENPDEDIQYQKQLFERLVDVESALASGNVKLRRRKVSVYIDSREHDCVYKNNTCEYVATLSQPLKRVVSAKLLDYGNLEFRESPWSFVLSLGTNLDESTSCVTSWGSSNPNFFAILSNQYTPTKREYVLPQNFDKLHISITDPWGEHFKIHSDHWFLFEVEVEEIDRMFHNSIPTRQKS
jgi:hypothetical protein